MKNMVLLSQDPSTQALLRSTAGVAHLELRVAATLAQLVDSMSMTANDGCIVIVGLDALVASQRSAARAVAKVREKLPTASIVLHAERKFLIDRFDLEWAKMCGADGIVPRITATRWMHSGDELLRFIEPDEAARARLHQRIMPYLRAAQQLEAKDEATKWVAACEASRYDLADLAQRMGRSGGVDIRDRSYHLRGYPECFAASDAVNWLAKALSVDETQAITVGRAIQATGLIYHVAREQSFANDYLFFRVARLPQTFVIADFVTQVSASTGFTRRDRSYLGTEYPHCFVGKEAIAWCRARRMSVNEAMTASQRLVDLSIVSHVINEHPLKDEELFYRFHGV
jgi:hypothetical protein